MSIVRVCSRQVSMTRGESCHHHVIKPGPIEAWKEVSSSGVLRHLITAILPLHSMRHYNLAAISQRSLKITGKLL